MHENVQKLLYEIQDLEYQISEKQRQLERIQHNCNHDFKSTHIHLLNTDELVCKICNLHKLG